MIAPVCAALTLALTASAGRPARAHARAPHAAHRQTAPARSSALDRARALLAQVKRDPAKRRYRHHWERAIRALERAARGGDRAQALLEASRARYALYRFSQVDADRDAALELALRARGAGAREGARLAAAIRKEMGEEEPRKAPPAASSHPSPTATSAAAAGEEGAATADADPEDGAEAGSESAGESEPEAAASSDEPDRGGRKGAPAEEPDDDALQEALADEAPPAAAADASADKGPARVSEVRSWSNKDYTRVAIYLSRRVDYEKLEIPPDGAHPRRVAIDLTPATLAHGLAHPVGDSLVGRVRAGQYDRDTVRVVLELPGGDAITSFCVDDPPRLIVDVGLREGRGETPPLAGRPPASEAPREATAPPPRRPEGEARGAIRRIIVDAGHGGHDSGAIGPTRVREKDVTLAIARRLARRLRALGFEAVLTRDDDRYLALEERTAIANARHGDLFISVHANAHPRRSRRGVETYFLNVTDDRYARRLAARENGALSVEGGEELEVRRILSDLNAQASAEASRRLAAMVQREVCAGIRSRVGDVRDLGVKSALFYVLLGARMPAVLVETSFISNRTEEKRLASPRFQEEVAAGVARAVSEFARQDARVAAR